MSDAIGSPHFPVVRLGLAVRPEAGDLSPQDVVTAGRRVLDRSDAASTMVAQAVEEAPPGLKGRIAPDGRLAGSAPFRLRRQTLIPTFGVDFAPQPFLLTLPTDRGPVERPAETRLSLTLCPGRWDCRLWWRINLLEPLAEPAAVEAFHRAVDASAAPWGDRFVAHVQDVLRAALGRSVGALKTVHRFKIGIIGCPLPALDRYVADPAPAVDTWAPLPGATERAADLLVERIDAIAGPALLDGLAAPGADTLPPLFHFRFSRYPSAAAGVPRAPRHRRGAHKYLDALAFVRTDRQSTTVVGLTDERIDPEAPVPSITGTTDRDPRNAHAIGGEILIRLAAQRDAETGVYAPRRPTGPVRDLTPAPAPPADGRPG